MTTFLFIIAWFVCFVFAWGCAWKYCEIKDDPALIICLVFVLVVATAPAIVVGVPFGRFAIWATRKVYGP